MEISKEHNHLNGKEWLLQNRADDYHILLEIIGGIDAEQCKRDHPKKGEVYHPPQLNKAFKQRLNQAGWEKKIFTHYATTRLDLIPEIAGEETSRQREILEEAGEEPVLSRKEIDFLKDRMGLEIQLGYSARIPYDLFVKHMVFYNENIIDVGIEIVPTRRMRDHMASGPGTFEAEVYNALRYGRNNPPVPLVILGVEPQALSM